MGVLFFDRWMVKCWAVDDILLSNGCKTMFEKSEQYEMKYDWNALVYGCFYEKVIENSKKQWKMAFLTIFDDFLVNFYHNMVYTFDGTLFKKMMFFNEKWWFLMKNDRCVDVFDDFLINILSFLWWYVGLLMIFSWWSKSD